MSSNKQTVTLVTTTAGNEVAFKIKYTFPGGLTHLSPVLTFTVNDASNDDSSPASEAMLKVSGNGQCSCSSGTYFYFQSKSIADLAAAKAACLADSDCGGFGFETGG